MGAGQITLPGRYRGSLLEVPLAYQPAPALLPLLKRLSILWRRTLLSKRRTLFVLPVWMFVSAWLWIWWVSGDHVATTWLFVPLTIAMLYEFAVLPSVFLYFVLRAKFPPRRIAIKNKKVAVITLCVPSQESEDIIERQLKAMSEITCAHDSWILDEGNSKRVKKLARKYGVKHFSRKGLAKYNQDIPPFKAKTKAGNVNAWLDRVKRRGYDYFVQLDIDHIPKPEYLDKTLGHFRNKQVAWVQAPSVYRNLQHWTARGSAEQELVLQGPLQMGFYGHGNTPFIIGSHCTYRMSAIRKIGGFQPTRAEDHLDTVALASIGYRGVFVPKIIAEGDGPETLQTYFAQQYAWAFSMFQVLMHHSPKLLRGMSLKLKLQFLFAQTWYPLWSLAYLVMFSVPIVALFVNRNVATISAQDFAIHFLPLYISTFLIWYAGRPLMQPKGLRLSWRGMLLHAVRWPVVLRAVLGAIFRLKKPYMITPKGKFSRYTPTVELYRPLIGLGAASAIAIIFSNNYYGNTAPWGLMFFALLNIAFMLVVTTVDLDLQLRRAAGKLKNFRRYWAKPTAAVMSLVFLGTAAVVSIPPIANAAVYIGLARDPVSNFADINSVKTRSPSSLNKNELVGELYSNTYQRQSYIAPDFGLYDPKIAPVFDQPYIRHSFIDWRDDRYLAQELVKTYRSNGVALITIEPGGYEDGQALLDGIAAGQFDHYLHRLLDIMEISDDTIYVRFAHEMDLAELYPWGAKQPRSYIAAYRQFVNLANKRNVSNLAWVWSPAGNDGAQAYYPGDDAVDVIGTTILYDRYWYYDYYPSFREIAAKRTWLTAYNKPLWITEFGVGQADLQFQQAMLNDAASQYRKLGFSALIYLNMVDANLVGPDYTLENPRNLASIFAPKVVAQKPIVSQENRNTFQQILQSVLTGPAQITNELVTSTEVAQEV